MTPTPRTEERWQEDTNYEFSHLDWYSENKARLLNFISHQKALSRAEVLEEVKKEIADTIKTVYSEEEADGDLHPGTIRRIEHLLSLSDTLAVVDKIKNKEENSMEEDKCILCSSPLCIYGEDIEVQGLTGTIYKYFCPKKKCKRYALLTVSNVDLESLTNN